MEVNYNEIVASVYTYLRSPSEEDLPLNLVLRRCRDEDQKMIVESDLSGENWRLSEQRFNTDEGKDTYTLPIAASDLGRVEFCEAELTQDSSDAQIAHGRRRVRVVDLRDQDARTGRQIANSTSLTFESGRRIEEISIYHLDGVPMARVSPWPSDPRTYIIYYERATIDPPALANIPNALKSVPAFFNLMIARVTRFCAPYVKQHLASKGVELGDLLKSLDVEIEHPTSGLQALYSLYLSNDAEEVDGFVDGFDLGETMGGFRF